MLLHRKAISQESLLQLCTLQDVGGQLLQVLAVVDVCNIVIYNLFLCCCFRALSKKLRAEELMKLSKLPPSMAKREEEIKKKEAMEELDVTARLSSACKPNVEFLPQKKKKLRKRVRRSKSSITPTRNQQYSKSYVFDSKRDRGSVKACRACASNEHNN